LTEQNGRLLFLIDEILNGTNSHDRRIGAASVVKSLLARGAVGLITTHDLALTQIVEEVQPAGANFHFEDQFADNRMSFDYRLRAGVVAKSNALELMRSIGLDVSADPKSTQTV
jgi:DNA mismatch repair ATPase MutS